jgi:hypothetical protein
MLPTMHAYLSSHADTQPFRVVVGSSTAQMLDLASALFDAMGDVGSVYRGHPSFFSDASEQDGSLTAYMSDRRSILFTNKVELRPVHRFHLLIHLGLPVSRAECEYFGD